MQAFQDLSVGLNVAVFILCAAGIWFAGGRLARCADEVSAATGMGEALSGMLILGGITSLPEMAVTVPVSIRGEADLAVNNLLGGVAFQVVIIAVGDALLRRRAITGGVAEPPLLLQPVVCSLLLCMAAAGILIGDVQLFGVGAWSTVILITAFGAFVWISRQKPGERDPDASLEDTTQNVDGARRSLWRSGGELILMGVILLGLGWAIAGVSESLIAQTGLQAGFFGFIFLAIATSLPELSTVAGAVRLDRPNMALGDIFGTNIFDIALIFLVDLAYAGGAVLNDLGSFSVLAALLGMMITLIYTLGLVERRDPVIGRLGVDSLAVLVIYAVGAAFLFSVS